MPGLNRPSLLDRLTDDHYESAPGPEDWGISVAQLERSVVADLNDLVNTARPDELTLPESLPEVRDSIAFYGLTRPGLLGKSAEDRLQVRRELEAAIRRFEPRLRRVRVEDVASAAATDPDANILPYAFQIHAELRLDPLPQSVLLDATLSRYPQSIRIAPGQPAPSPPLPSRSGEPSDE